MYPSYLVHYNKNHSKANGQFVSGDGDGDGIVNDHKNQKTKRPLLAYGKKEKAYYNSLSDEEKRRYNKTEKIYSGASALAGIATGTLTLASAQAMEGKGKAFLTAAGIADYAIGVTGSFVRAGRAFMRDKEITN